MKSWARKGCLAVFAIGAGCGDDSGELTGSSMGTDGNTTQTDTGVSATDPGSAAATEADASSSSGPAFEPPDPECGNGFVEANEQCDDANKDDGDDCSNECQLRCGQQWSSVTLAPTGQSQINPSGVARDVDGNVIVVGIQREIAADQKGNETAEDRVAVVLKFDGAGAMLWEAQLDDPGAGVFVAGVAVDPGGDIYVAATVAPLGGSGDIVAYKLASEDGDVQWRHVHDSAVDTADDIAFDVTVAPDGTPVVSGQVRVAEGDDDVWIARLDASTGVPEWTSTWSGTPSGGFSTDGGGQASVGPEGQIYVLAEEYVDFQTRLATLVTFASVGGPAEQVQSLMVEGGLQSYESQSVAAGADGSVLVSFVRSLASGPEYYLARLESDGLGEVWRLDEQVFANDPALRGGRDITITTADYREDSGLVATGLLERSLDGASWVETWTAQLSPEGALGCMFVSEGPQDALVPGSLFVRALSTTLDGGAVITAQELSSAGEALWVGAFRPQ